MYAKTAIRRLSPILLLGALGLVLGCSAEQQLCSAVCDCEHCNDYREEIYCAQLDSNADIAAEYGCDEKWSDYVDCVLEKGECKEKEANFSTEEPGTCGAAQNVGASCMSNADCAPWDGATCNSGQCVQRTCSGSSGYPCQTNDDCPGGQDRCQEKLTALYECQSDASEHGGVTGVNPGNPPAPQPAGN